MVERLECATLAYAVTPLVTHGFSNIIVSLVDESRSLVFEVCTNALDTHYWGDFTVDDVGPNASHLTMESGAQEPRIHAADSIMMAFATGIDILGNAVRLRNDNPVVHA